MKSFRLGAVLGLVLVWATVPWAPIRWMAAATAAFLGLGALWSVVVSRSLGARASDPVLRTFSGGRVEVRTQVENRCPLPSGLLFVGDSSGGLETWGPTRRFTGLHPFSRLRFTFTVRGRERGLRSLGPLRVTGTDPTGLYPFAVEAPPRSLIVYPRFRTVVGWPPGGHPSGPRSWEPALDDVSRFRTFRDFRPGDALARLSAAAWARAGTPQVRTFDRTVALPTGVVVDLRASLYPLKLRWALVESAVETSASLVWDLLGRGESVWLTVLDAGGADRPVTLGPARGWASARTFLERLALAAPDKSEVPAPCSAGTLPAGALRLLWIGPPGADPPVGARGVVRFPVGEGGGGVLVHP